MTLRSTKIEEILFRVMTSWFTLGALLVTVVLLSRPHL